jgi:hypothetical protein
MTVKIEKSPATGRWTEKDTARFSASAKQFNAAIKDKKAAREYLVKLGTHDKDGKVAKAYRK